MTIASIVTYNTALVTLGQLLRCIEQSAAIAKVYVIDNARDELTRRLVADFKKAQYMPSDNVGYGRAHNKAMRLSLEQGADYHLVLNPDVAWEGDVVTELERYMHSAPDCGLVMPRVMNLDGTEQHLCKLLPTPIDLMARRFVPFKVLRLKHVHRFEMHWADHDRVIEAPSLSGCFMMMRCSVLRQVGLFDKRFFLYIEDLDLCRRIGEVTHTRYYPYAQIMHGYQRGSYKHLSLLRHHIGSAIKYFTKWGWVIDKKRVQVNARVLANPYADGQDQASKN